MVVYHNVMQHVVSTPCSMLNLGAALVVLQLTRALFLFIFSETTPGIRASPEKHTLLWTSSIPCGHFDLSVSPGRVSLH